MKKNYQGLLIFVGVAAICLGGGAASYAEAQNQTKRCETPEYRQFDFWVGNWEVHDKKGELEGKNLITREQNGCVIIEHWDSGDQTGISLSMYDNRTKEWYQSWIDSFGNMLIIHGRFEKGSMVLEGKRPTPEGKTALERTTWTPLEDGRVHQLWDYSLDEGKTWTLRFEGFYTKKQPTTKDEQGLLDMENQWFNASGLEALEHIYASDFFHVIADGRMATKQSELNYLRQHGPAPTTSQVAYQNAHHHFEDLKVRIYGDVGIVNGRTVVTGEKAEVIHKTSFTDVFIWRDGHWHAINAQETLLNPEFWDDKAGQ